MRKALFWILIGFISFAVLVAIIFGYLSYMEKKNGEDQEVTESGELPEYIDKSQRDSLANLITMKDSLIAVKDSKNDSLTNLIQTHETTINEQKQNIQELREQMENNQNKSENIKSLAKTYESMRVEDLRPILKEINDNTLINIYQQMSSRKRQKLIQALTPQRAARLTTKLAS
ncbi:MAG: hypothetical protein K9N00_00550 [Candidatus Marinimicrobia bacterium]|nr:hypothetical protein [Candidatus Neomarinimicrobiota bacterium]